jgi:calmodulin
MAETAPLTEEQINQFQVAMNAFYENDDEAQLIELFRLFDRNGDGKIVADELRTVMSSVQGERVSEDEVQDMLTEADTDKNSNIDLQEFIAVMKKHKQ